jgi:tRNA-specific 2-thiouridylase
MSERVLVAMSGGVDSSVAAALLVRQGYEVVGVTLHLWDYPDDGTVKSRCCAPEDIHDARRVCDALGIPHYAFDRRELFQSEVVAPFVSGYLDGTTPSPCVRCNRGVKLKELITIADRLSARRVATGHYARVVDEQGVARLHRALDHSKDQSYFLHMLEESVLARLVFPLGEWSKAKVRELAVELDLPGATKGESQELCFVPTGRYDAFVEERAGDRVRPGPIVGSDGAVIGQHQGVHRFTVGQRKNVGVALGHKAYVVDVDATSGRVVVGDQQDLRCTSALLTEFALAKGYELPLECQVAVRYRGQTHPARVTADPQGALVHFDEPLAPVVRGQFAVLYHEQHVLGGGLIRDVSTLRSAALPLTARESAPSPAST